MNMLEDDKKHINFDFITEGSFIKHCFNIDSNKHRKTSLTPPLIISALSWQTVLLMRKPEYPEKTIDLSQATDKLYHIMFYLIHHAMNWIQTHNFNGGMQ